MKIMTNTKDFLSQAIKLVSGNGVLFLNEIGLLLKPNEKKEIK